MINKKTAKLIMERWIAELHTKDRTAGNIANNFDELFSEWYHAGISFEDAYNLVEEALKAHYPSASIARRTFKLKKQEWHLDKSEKEFIDDWNKGIRDTGLQVFYNYFQIDGETPSQPQEKKTYGSMSTGEYLKQRKYMDSIPTLDVDSLPEFKPISEDIFDDFPEMNEDNDCDVDLGEI